MGEWATTTLGIGRGDSFELIREIRFPHSLGLLYSAFTYYLGFKVNSAEYKVMGAAPYGKPKYVSKILEELVDLRDDGSFKLNMKYFAYDYGLTMTNQRFAQLFGHPRRESESKMEEFHWDMAASVQHVTEEIVLRMVRELHKNTGMKNLCMAGGVALNCVANGRIVREGPFERLWVQPAAGDAGGALGAALFAYHAVLGKPRAFRMEHAFWGPAYSDEAIRAYLDAQGARYRTLPRDEMIRETARQLNEEQAVVGWFQGRMEWGPRSLGSRSILADARNRENWQRVNLKIKFRESFRPFAPAVLAEKASAWFDIDRESPYMLLVCQVRPGREIPAVTHVDNSARIQTVTRDAHPEFYDLISRIRSADRLPGDHQHVVQRARGAHRLLAGRCLPLLHANQHGRARARQSDPAQGRAARAARRLRLARALPARLNRRPSARTTTSRAPPGEARRRWMARSTGGFLDRFSIFRELWSFMKVRKKWWLGPIVVTMLLLSVLIVLTEGSAVAPFIYALF